MHRFVIDIDHVGAPGGLLSDLDLFVSDQVKKTIAPAAWTKLDWDQSSVR